MSSLKLALSAIALLVLTPSTFGNNICDNVAQWNSRDVYTGDKKVTFNGDLWKAKWWTLNDQPGHNQENVWVNLGPCNGQPKPSSPAQGGSGKCADISEWNSGVAYTGNKKVFYDGHLWEAKWWTLNDQPGHNQENVWTDLGSCVEHSVPAHEVKPSPKHASHTESGNGACSNVPQWNSGDVYTGGHEVVYNNGLWKAKWWTRSNEPGNNQENVWDYMGSCNGKHSTPTHKEETKPTKATKHASKPTEASHPHEHNKAPAPSKHVEPSKPSGAFDASCNDNLAVYWGQNSFGGSGGGPSGWQKNLAYYCQDDTVDVIPVAFLDTFFGAGGLPELNLANTCNMKDNKVFPNSNLLFCPNVGEDIKFCQSRGKSIILSLGGAGGSYGFHDDEQAKNFATQLWNLFLGGQSDTRPFGDAILDGVDLDIEGGGPTGYVAFVNQLRSHYEEDKNKKYLITGAPQCVYPDAELGSTLNSAWFDLVFVQFYNNPCDLQYYDNYRAWNYGVWDYWATHISPNPNVKVYIGAPAAPKAAGTGYVPIEELKTIAQETRSKFTSFGGVMFWDASQAWANHVEGGNYAQATKQFLKNGGGCNVKPNLPSCNSVPGYSPSGSYPGGSTVSHNGYIWKALWWVQGQAPGVNGAYWSAVSGCTNDRRISRRAAPEFATNLPSEQLAKFMVQKNLGDYLVTFSNLKLESNQFQMGVKITSLKPGNSISDKWRLTFPYNSTVVNVNGASSALTEGNLVLSAITPKNEFKATQFMSVFVDVHGQVDGKPLEEFPFPDVEKAVFSA